MASSPRRSTTRPPTRPATSTTCPTRRDGLRSTWRSARASDSAARTPSVPSPATAAERFRSPRVRGRTGPSIRWGIERPEHTLDGMTDVNGLRLPYRGFIAGLAGGYVWAAIAMLLAALAEGDPLRPLRPIALALTPIAGSPELAFVLGLAAVQAGGAVIGMCFAYFFARFF